MLSLAEKSLEKWLSSSEAEAPVVFAGEFEDIHGFIAAYKDIERHILEEVGRTISIKSLRELFSAAAKTSWQRARLIVIPRAERLSLPASHALLKHLEEPSPTNRWLLTTRFPQRLLLTIRSRVQIVRPTAPSPGESLRDTHGGRLELNFAGLLAEKKRPTLSPQQLDSISAVIQAQVRAQPGSTATYRALLRFRDYYKIRALGGSERLAGDVLLASLVELR